MSEPAAYAPGHGESSKKAKIPQLTRGAINVLSTVLSLPGWYSDPRSALRAGRILVDNIDKIDGVSDELKDGASKEQTIEYLSTKFELNISQSGRELCKSALNYFLSGGKLHVNKYLLEAADYLGIE